MIDKFLPSNEDIRDSSVIYLSNLEQIIYVYNEISPEIARELAISTIELAITGHISSDNPYIKAMLRPYKDSFTKK